MKKLILTTFYLMTILSFHSQSPNWTSIKNNVVPFVNDTSEFGTPFIQPHHNLGWEDGMYMSRDGLHMYAFYLPADLILFAGYLGSNPACPSITDYLRGPLLGVDTITNPWGCASLLHSDIIYTSRADTSLPFDPWQSSNLANPTEWEGAPQIIYKADGTVDIMTYTMSNNGDNNLYWIRDTINNPNGPGELIPSPVNDPAFTEDNPHMERIDDSTLVLFMDNHASAGLLADIYYTISYDNGTTWLPKSLLSSVNTPYEDIHPHFWTDGFNNWLYFSSSDTLDTYNRASIFRMKQMIPDDFNSWGNRELVIGPGSVTDGSGFVGALGEPTLTTWGDLSFVLVVQATGTSDTTDLYEIDPWYLPRKNPVVASIQESLNKTTLKISPNPMKEYSVVQFSGVNSTTINSYKLFNYNGKIVKNEKEVNKNKILIRKENLATGFYLIQVTDSSGKIISGKIIVN